MVIGNDKSYEFDLKFTNEALGIWVFMTNKETMTINHFYSICMRNDGNDLTINKNMCDYFKIIYDGELTKNKNFPT